jgi:hypothetical protein
MNNNKEEYYTSEFWDNYVSEDGLKYVIPDYRMLRLLILIKESQKELIDAYTCIKDLASSDEYYEHRNMLGKHKEIIQKAREAQ